MSVGDSYLPSPVQVSSDGSQAAFDGDSSSTDSAIVESLSSEAEVEIRYEGWNGSSWEILKKLQDSNGNTTHTPPFHTQINRLYVSPNDRRILFRVIDNASTYGYVSIEGQER